MFIFITVLAIGYIILAYFNLAFIAPTFIMMANSKRVLSLVKAWKCTYHLYTPTTNQHTRLTWGVFIPWYSQILTYFPVPLFGCKHKHKDKTPFGFCKLFHLLLHLAKLFKCLCLCSTWACDGLYYRIRWRHCLPVRRNRVRFPMSVV